MLQAKFLISASLVFLAVASANGAPGKPTVDVKWMRTKSEVVVRANLEDFVVTFRQVAAQRLNPQWNPKQLVLSFNGKNLEDGNTLEEMGIQEGSIIGYYYIVVGDTQIWTRMLKHKEWFMYEFVYLNMTVAELRDIEAADEPTWDRNKIDLFLGDKKLEDKYTLKHYGIKKNSYVDVLNRNFE